MNSEWWYLLGPDRIGPVSIDELSDLIRRRQLDSQSLVWCKDFADWTAIADVSELADALSTTTTTTTKTATTAPAAATLPDLQALHDDVAADPGALTPAGPWRRFWARMIDLWVISFSVAFAMGIVASMFGYRTSGPASDSGLEAVLGFLVLPLAMTLEAVIFGLTGSTPGKAALRVRVLTFKGRRPTFGQYLVRQAGLYWFGLALGIPFVSLFTMARQHRRVKTGVGARYDVDRFQVLGGRIGVLRIGSAVVIVALILLASSFAQLVTKGDRRGVPRQRATAIAPPADSAQAAARVQAPNLMRNGAQNLTQNVTQSGPTSTHALTARE